MLFMDSWLTNIRRITETHLGNGHGQRLLLAVSGGADSMALLAAFAQLPWYVEVAHVNYRMRGEASDGDEQWVKNWCDRHNIVVHVKHLPGPQAVPDGSSFQDWAREQRYTFFREVMREQQLQVLCTAHHREDQVETFILQAMRSAGARGLGGMKVYDPPLFRPFLGLSRQDIRAWLGENRINFREDVSNQSIAYTRNRIRLKVLPELEKCPPAGYSQIPQSMTILQRQWRELQFQMKRLEDKMVLPSPHPEVQALSRQGLLDYVAYPANFLQAWLDKDGFHRKDVMQMEKAITSGNPASRIFRSEKYTVEVHGDCIYRYPLQLLEENLSETFPGPEALQKGIPAVEVLAGNRIPAQWEKGHGYFDLDKISFPLEIRTWREGDKIQPIGMKGHRLISAVLKDVKLPAWRKKLSRVWVSGDRIIWLEGRVTSAVVRIESGTNRILHVNWPDNGE